MSEKEKMFIYIRSTLKCGFRCFKLDWFVPNRVKRCQSTSVTQVMWMFSGLPLILYLFQGFSNGFAWEWHKRLLLQWNWYINISFIILNDKP